MIEATGLKVGSRIAQPARRVLAFYVGVPLATALIMGMNHAGSAEHMDTLPSLLYWSGISIILWALLDGLSRAALTILQPWSPPIWVSLLAGSIFAMIVFAPVLQFYSKLVFPILAPGIDIEVPRTLIKQVSNPLQLFSFIVVPVYWLLSVLAFARIFGYPRYAIAGLPSDPVAALSRPDEDSEPQRVGLFALIPHKIGLDIISLHAEDHYVRVNTLLGSALVRYRFSEAVKEARLLGGVQVHRSHWVRLSKVTGVKDESGIKHVTLQDGSSVPVSRSYVGVLKAVNLI
nr:LytTR family DNA-binding domain-containing protein [Hyphomonas sp. Mor2]